MVAEAFPTVSLSGDKGSDVDERADGRERRHGRGNAEEAGCWMAMGWKLTIEVGRNECRVTDNDGGERRSLRVNAKQQEAEAGQASGSVLAGAQRADGGIGARETRDHDSRAAQLASRPGSDSSQLRSVD